MRKLPILLLTATLALSLALPAYAAESSNEELKTASQYPWQSQFVDRYIGGRAQLREISLPDLEDALGLGAGEGADEGS